MAQGLIFVVATVMVCLVPGVRGTAHLMFASDTTVNITRTGCGATKLCLETPADCDPNGNGSCLFTSIETRTAMAPTLVDLYVGLRGESGGYIALGLTANSSMGITKVFLCGNMVNPNNSRIFFRTMQLNNTDNSLTPLERPVKMIRGMVNGTVIRCEFNIPNATADVRVMLGTGALNGTMVGPVNFTFNGGLQNLTNPASNLNGTSPGGGAMTPAPGGGATTESGASGVFQPHAMPILLGVLVWLVSLRT